MRTFQNFLHDYISLEEKKRNCEMSGHSKLSFILKIAHEFILKKICMRNSCKNKLS